MSGDNLRQCLPPELRGPGTVISPIAAGLSGAGVHRVEAAGKVFVLKVAPDSEAADAWDWALRNQLLAAATGLSPEVVYYDEQRRAVLTEFVPSRSFEEFYGNSSSHNAAVALLGKTVRRIHKLPIAVGPPGRDPRAFLGDLWDKLQQVGFTLPAFASQGIERALAEAPPPATAPLVLSHNDLNPTNFIYDGKSIQILDWAVAEPNDPYYDLAVLAVFLRMSQDSCLHLLSAYANQPVTSLPDRFSYFRRLAGALAGTAQLSFAHKLRHPGATDPGTTALPLVEFYRQLRTHGLRLGTPEGHWAFGLSLINESLAVTSAGGR